MKEHHPALTENENNKALGSLVERLDPSIGELSTVTGAMVTELLRRTLRGSVRQIDEELQDQVAQRVDETVAQRLPAIEQSAAEAADKAARVAATEVALEEVQALEARARESEREISARIETSARAAQEQVIETARTLTGKIELVERQAEEAIAGKAHELNRRIEETARSAANLTDEKARALARHIEEAEQRANLTSQEEMTRQVEELRQRSRKAVAEVKERLQALETALGKLQKQLLDEAAGRIAQGSDLERRLKEMTMRLDKLEQEWGTAVGQLRRDREEEKQRHEALMVRVAELEKPRGLQSLWQRLRGRGSKPSPDQQAADVTEKE